MSQLSMIVLVIGLTAFFAGCAALLFPARVRSALTAFPRHALSGRILGAAALIWAAYALSRMHLGRFDDWKGHLLWLTPVAIGLCIVYLDELLAPRALGGMLLLAAGPILQVASQHPSAWRLVITALAYLWIFAGLLFLLSPWWFRRIVQATTRTDRLIRGFGAIKVLAGLLLVVLALFVY